MGFGLLVIGDEILSGKRADAHLPKVAALLRERGMALAWARVEGDDRARLTSVMRELLASPDVVFSCGGIGATPDDHTRQAVAAAMGVPLELHPQAAARITQRMRTLAAERGQAFDADSPANRQRLQMGMFPRGATLVENPYNGIPGFSVGRLHCVPGFPVMAWPMIEALLDGPYAGHHGGERREERSMIVLGAIEAVLTPLMEAVEAGHPGVRVFSLPSVDHPEWGQHIELGVKGPPAALAAAYADLRDGVLAQGAHLGTELVR